MKIAIYGSRRQAPHAAEIQALLTSLAQAGAELSLHPKLYRHLTADLQLTLPEVACAEAESAPVAADLVLSIGGDGTFLRTAAWVGALETPVLGINTGTLGYLTALGIDEATAKAADIVSAKFVTEPRNLIMATAPGLPGPQYALNEIVVAKDDHASIVSIAAEINGSPLATYRADGLIISTPTGSTAYNLSVGGPVVQPDAPVWVVTPIAAHSLGMRPVVVSDASELMLNVSARSSHFRLTVDGRAHFLPVDTAVRVVNAPFQVIMVQWPGRTFPYALRKKLMFD